MEPVEMMVKDQLENMQIEPGKDLRGKVLTNVMKGGAAPHSVKRRIGVNTVLFAAGLAVFLLTTGFVYKDAIIGTIVYVFSEKQYPVEGYAMINVICDHIVVYKSEETPFDMDGYIIGLDETEGKFTLENVASNNGEILFLTPKGYDGFLLSKGDTLSLSATLDLTPNYADKEAGELIEVGCYSNGEFYKTFFGKLPPGGDTFIIEAPFDGEFMIYIINGCAAIENYEVISIFQQIK